jgi:hypothetical protein
VADEKPELSEQEVERATNLLDIRRIIGTLLGIYGLLLLGAGLFGSDADKNKASGVNINLWVALALLAASALFWLWASTRPLIDELEDEV